MYPSREEFTELIYYISELKHQYSSKIDEQTIKLNDQSGVIEELLWQIRELSDKMRQMNQKVEDISKQLADSNEKCVCRYENHIPRNRSIFSRQTSMLSNRNTARIAKGVKDATEFIKLSYRFSLEFWNVLQIRRLMMMIMMYTRPSSLVIHHRTFTQSRFVTTACYGRSTSRRRWGNEPAENHRVA